MIRTCLMAWAMALPSWGQSAGTPQFGDARWKFANGREVIFKWAGERAGVYWRDGESYDPQPRIAGELFGLGVDSLDVRTPLVPTDGIMLPDLQFKDRRGLIITTRNRLSLINDAGAVVDIPVLQSPRVTNQGQIVARSLGQTVRGGRSVQMLHVPWRTTVTRNDITYSGEAWVIRDDGVAVRFALTTEQNHSEEISWSEGVVGLGSYPRRIDLDHLEAEATVQTGFVRPLTEGRTVEPNGWKLVNDLFVSVPRRPELKHAYEGPPEILEAAVDALTDDRHSVALIGPPGRSRDHFVRALLDRLPRTWTIFEINPDGFNSFSGFAGTFDARISALKSAAEVRPVVWLLRDLAAFHKLGLTTLKVTDFFDGLTTEMNSGLVRVVGLADAAGYARLTKGRPALDAAFVQVERTLRPEGRAPGAGDAFDRASHRQTLARLERELSARLPGNPVARAHLVEAARATLFDLHGPERPRATGVLLGPSGAGKTALLKLYAKILDRPFERILMSAFATPYEVSAFLRTAGEFARAHPNGILFLDELDEAAPNIQNVMLAALDSNTLHQPGAGVMEPVFIGGMQIFAATNAGEDMVRAAARQGRSTSEEALASAASGELSKKFLDRVDFLAPVYPADAATYRLIVRELVRLALDHLKIKPEQIVNFPEMIDRLVRLRPHSASSHREAERAVNRGVRQAVGELLADPRVGDLTNARYRFDDRLRIDCASDLETPARVLEFRRR